jgi:hypothetical protein
LHLKNKIKQISQSEAREQKRIKDFDLLQAGFLFLGVVMVLTCFS